MPGDKPDQLNNDRTEVQPVNSDVGNEDAAVRLRSQVFILPNKTAIENDKKGDPEGSPIAINDAKGADQNSTTPRFSFDALRSQMSLSGISEEAILSSIKPQNFMGKGGSAAMYRIDGISDFVLRVPFWGESIELSGSMEPVADILPGTNVGQPIARIGSATILKLQEGITAGGPLRSTVKVMGVEQAQSIYAESVKRAASMPQSAYDEFAKTLLILDKNGLNFDMSKANNILIDVPNQQFNLVDINAQSPGSDHRPSLSQMIVPLIDNGFAYSHFDNHGVALVDSYRAILSKSLAAAERAGLLINPNDTSLRFSFRLAKMDSDWEQLEARIFLGTNPHLRALPTDLQGSAFEGMLEYMRALEAKEQTREIVLTGHPLFDPKRCELWETTGANMSDETIHALVAMRSAGISINERNLPLIESIAKLGQAAGGSTTSYAQAVDLAVKSDMSRPERGVPHTTSGGTSIDISQTFGGTFHADTTDLIASRPRDRAPERLNEDEIIAIEARRQELQSKQDLTPIEERQLMVFQSFSEWDPESHKDIIEAMRTSGVKRPEGGFDAEGARGAFSSLVILLAAGLAEVAKLKSQAKQTSSDKPK